MIASVLIANRGEIACRIIRSAKHLGIKTVAIFSGAEQGCRHASLADRAFLIESEEPRSVYLDQQRIIDVARKASVEAIHPGYGFLAENAGFARLCQDAGLIFVGPSPEAIETMGRKDEARNLAASAGVPTVPGYAGEHQSIAALRAAASDLGLPVLIKPSAGGGGKGMRIVSHCKDLDDAIAGARREARAAFGDDHLVLEKYLDRARHIEVQVFGDDQGNVVNLFERDCSLQRRHQKIIEEAPAVEIGPKVRADMLAAAVRLAEQIGYRGAGTVEFLLDGDQNFYFIEMNTRLQVEHPVTEAITGEDLVEWQFRVASCEKLPKRQSELRSVGHAIEARIYAEDPETGFLPSTGEITSLKWPKDSVRIESAIRPGDEVTPHFDPMIAKLIVRGATRAEAVGNLRETLALTEIEGVRTNLAFLTDVASTNDFAEARIDTAWLDRTAPDEIKGHWPLKVPGESVAATVAILDRIQKSQVPKLAGWRLNAPAVHHVAFEHADGPRLVRLHQSSEGFFDPDGNEFTARLESDDLVIGVEGEQSRCRAFLVGSEVCLLADGCYRHFRLAEARLQSPQAGQDPGHLTAPMPGKVTSIGVEVGDSVTEGALLATLEAMKMEHRFKAPAAGTVKAIFVKVGDQIDEGTVIVDIDAG